MSVRYLAIKYIYNLINNMQFKKQINLKNTLNEYMAIMQAKEMKLDINVKVFPTFYGFSDSDFNIDYILMKFENVIDWIYENIGVDAFKNIKSSSNSEIIYKNSIQSTLAESLMVAVSLLLEENCISTSDCRDKLNKLLIEEKFQDLIGKDTMNCDRIQERINRLKECLRQ